VDFRQADHVREGKAHRLDVLGITWMVAEQVDRHHAAVVQAGVTGLVELGGVEHRTARGGVVQIALQDVKGCVVVRVEHEIHRIHLEHAQALVLRRQLEHRFADRDHGRVQFDRGDGRLWELAIAELGQSGSTQAKLGDGAWRVDEQHPGHHLLRIFEFRPVWLADAHGALHPFGTEVEIAHAVLFGQCHRGKLGFARGFGRGFGGRRGCGAARGLGQFDGFAFDEHRTT
jgi:hypothetical protein